MVSFQYYALHVALLRCKKQAKLAGVMLIVLPLPGGAGGSVDDTTSFDAFGGAFSGTLPEALPAGIEPTVTINTLAAYSDMNDMFQSALPHTATHTSGLHVISRNFLFVLPSLLVC
jgi:hypothetical protein